MRAHAIVIYLAATLQLVLAAAPDYVILRTHLLPNQEDKSKYDKLYMTLYGPIKGDQNPTFQKSNADALIFTIEQAQPASGSTPALNYLTYNVSDITFFLQMDFLIQPYAAWVPTSLVEQSNNGGANAVFQDRFYIDGGNLTWSNDRSSTGRAKASFVDWLVCDWWWDQPQLFFTLKRTYFPLNPVIPSSCAKVNLEIIPVTGP